MPISTASEGSMDRQIKRSSTAPKLVLEPVRESSRLESYPLATGRYLIGASSECDIVIAVGGVAPQHCLMIVGANKTVVKAISPLTWINDGPLTEAVLKHGERLILGPVELRTRRPEVSEWIDVQQPEPPPPVALTSYQPPAIEELLDHARQQLQSVIDDPLPNPTSWAEDLPLADAIQRHAATAAITELSATKQAAAQALLDVQQREFEQRAVELAERARALDYLSTELSARDEQLRSQAQVLSHRERHTQLAVVEADHREQALMGQERSLQNRHQESATALQLLAERSRKLDEEQTRVQELTARLESQVPDLEQYAATLAERVQGLDRREAELTAREAVLQEQAQARPVISPIDTTAFEEREAALTKREAILTSSKAALQTSRDQITQDAAQLEQRFAELIEREQSAQQRHSSLLEQTKRADADTLAVSSRLAALEERERATSVLATSVTEREASLQQLKSDVDQRDRELTARRSELDIQEESLNQQFSQLQLDRSALRAGQSKLQLVEQAAHQRLADLEQSIQQRAQEREVELDRRHQAVTSLVANGEQQAAQAQEQQRLFAANEETTETLRQRVAELEEALQEAVQRGSRLQHEHAALTTAAATAPLAAELEQQWANLAQERAEFTLDQRELEEVRAELEAQRNQLDAEQKTLVEQQPISAVINRTALDAEWQALAEEHQKLTADRDALAALQCALLSPDDESTAVGGHVQALLEERTALAEIQADMEREHHALRQDREETQRIRLQFEQEHEQLRSIKSESEAERDIYLLERQTLIAERQALQDRERQIKKSEAEAEQHRSETEKESAKLESLRKQFGEQQVHLEEEWNSLRDERAELQRVELELDAQRDELAHFAQQLAEVQAVSKEPVASGVGAIHPVPFERFAPPASVMPKETALTESINHENPSSVTWELANDSLSESEPDVEEDDPLAGFASFSSIGAEADDVLPPEIAEIIRRAGGQTAPTPPVTSSQTPVVVAAPAPLRGAEVRLAPNSVAHNAREDQRLRDLLGRSSESFVDAALASTREAFDSQELSSSESGEPYATAWDGDLRSDQPEASTESLERDGHATSRLSHEIQNTGSTSSPMHHDRIAEPEAPAADAQSAQLRSRLSEMFGISLGGARPATAPVPAAPDHEDVEASADEPEADTRWAGPSSEHDSGDQDFNTTESSEEQQEEQQRSEEIRNAVDESLDPVAAYMEQLLARTRKTKDAGSHAKAAPPPPPPVPVEPVVAVAPVEVPVEKKTSEPESSTSRQNRQKDPEMKEALRANLDSFRTIANSRARSDVARSEIRRLKIAAKVKQIFLLISGGIALILATTELWTTRRYRIEIAAALIATAFLGFDYWRTQRRRQELGLIAPIELDDEEGVEQEGSAA